MSAPTWDPDQYDRFREERRRPFLDLIAHIPEDPVRFAADLGCGTGELTRLLLDKWPEARIWGVDSSDRMVQRTRASPPTPRLTFVKADLAEWKAPRPLDRIVSNAALHWVPDHERLLKRLGSLLAPGGVLAVQIPNNRSEPAYRLLAELLGEPRWAPHLSGRVPTFTVETPEWYMTRLRDLGLEVDLWETVYLHQLAGPEAIVDWLKGTALRPVLSALAPVEATEFVDALTPRIAAEYPVGASGVLFPFRRLFFVARRSTGRIDDPDGVS